MNLHKFPKRFIQYRAPFGLFVEALYEGDPTNYTLGSAVRPQEGDALIHQPSSGTLKALGELGLRVSSIGTGHQRRGFIVPLHVIAKKQN